MALITLKEDLLHEFIEEQIMINEQLEILDPLATSLRKPVAQRLINSSALLLAEFGCYALAIGSIVAIVMIQRIYPFTILSNTLNDPAFHTKYGANNVMYLTFSLYGISSAIALFFFIIGRMSRAIRQKNDILYVAGKDIKTIVAQHLVRKAELDIIEQRHLFDMSGIHTFNDRSTQATGYQQKARSTVNDVYNPGFGD